MFRVESIEFLMMDGLIFNPRSSITVFLSSDTLKGTMVYKKLMLPFSIETRIPGSRDPEIRIS
jgi:hypothetical protein